jgi:hypothetical protein
VHFHHEALAAEETSDNDFVYDCACTFSVATSNTVVVNSFPHVARISGVGKQVLYSSHRGRILFLTISANGKSTYWQVPVVVVPGARKNLLSGIWMVKRGYLATLLPTDTPLLIVWNPQNKMVIHCPLQRNLFYVSLVSDLGA